jgi:hypothetical protein
MEEVANEVHDKLVRTPAMLALVQKWL